MEGNIIEAQYHLQVHRWCIVHNKPRIRQLSWPIVSCFIWDQGHYREHHLCFLPRFTTIDWKEGQLQTSIYDKRYDFNFHITNFPFMSSNIPSSPAYGDFISRLYDTHGLAPRTNVLFWGPWCCLMGHSGLTYDVQYLTKMLYNRFRYDSVKMKWSYIMAFKYYTLKRSDSVRQAKRFFFCEHRLWNTNWRWTHHFKIGLN